MKRTKLIASLMMCVFCLSFLVVGVWATMTSVNFNLNGNLQYYPEGVYVELSGQVYRGDSISTLEPLTSDTRFTLEPTTNYDNSTGEPSGNFPMGSWNIQNLTFTPVDRFIQVEVNIKNHSEFTIMATPNVLLNSLDITSNTFSNFTVTDNRSEVGAINSGATTTYTLLIQLNENATAFTDNILSVSFTFDSLISLLTWVEDDPDTTDVVDGYWTLTMGEHEGTPLVWRMVLKEENNDVRSVVGYTQDTALSGSYYFLLETYIADVFECSYENWYFRAGFPSRLDGKDGDVNSYSLSNIRDYLTGTNVYRSYSSESAGGYEGANIIEALHSSQQTPENFLDKFNVRNSIVYSLITPRMLEDISGTPEDKLWLLSYDEASKITSTESTSADTGARSWGYRYWTRTTYNWSVPLVAYTIESDGSIGQTSSNVSYTNCARPAFKISF